MSQGLNLNNGDPHRRQYQYSIMNAVREDTRRHGSEKGVTRREKRLYKRGITAITDEEWSRWVAVQRVRHQRDDAVMELQHRAAEKERFQWLAIQQERLQTKKKIGQVKSEARNREWGHLLAILSEQRAEKIRERKLEEERVALVRLKHKDAVALTRKIIAEREIERKLRLAIANKEPTPSLANEESRDSVNSLVEFSHESVEFPYKSPMAQIRKIN